MDCKNVFISHKLATSVNCGIFIWLTTLRLNGGFTITLLTHRVSQSILKSSALLFYNSRFCLLFVLFELFEGSAQGDLYYMYTDTTGYLTCSYYINLDEPRGLLTAAF